MPSAIRFTVRLLGVCGLIVLCGAGLASAQSTPQTAPPAPVSQGVFGGVPSRSDPASSTGLLVSVTEAYDDNVLGEATTPIDSSLQATGVFTELNANLTTHAGRGKTQFSSSAGTDFRYYSDQSEVVGIGHYGSAALTVAPSPQTSVAVTGGVAYAPSYLYRLFANAAAMQPDLNVASGYAVTDNSSYNYEGRLTVSEKLGSRNRLVLQTGARYTDFRVPAAQVGNAVLRDLATYEGGATFSRSVSRDVNVNIGYTYRRAQYYTGVFPTEHDINIGVDYDHPLSRTRRTHLRLNAATVVLDAVAPADPSGVLRRQYRVVGDAALSRQFNRTWQAEGAYRRGVGYIEGITTPVLTDALTVSTSGLLSPRVDLVAKGAYSIGEPVAFGESNGFKTYTADVRLRFALNATWAVYSEYLYYYYDFSQGFVPIGAPPTMARNSVRAGLTLWLPLAGR